jgi:threonine 3-dehydrogenase
MMKALVKKKACAGVWIEEVKKPVVGPEDVLIKIKKTAICGTDIHIYNWDEWAQQNVPVPTIIGHEFVGVVEAVGDLVKGIKKGCRVSGEGHLTCGICRNCRAGKRHLCRETVGFGYHSDGCFADYAVLPESNVMKLPDDITDDQAAILDPLGNATHTALSFDLVGEDVLVTGAGPTGLMACAIAKKVGARYVVVTDVNPYRLAIAEKMGATLAIDASKTNLQEVKEQLGMHEGFDVGFEMSGNPRAFCDMLDAMNHGGRIAMLGIPPNDIAINWSKVIFKSLTIKGVYGREIFETWYKMISMLQSGLDVSPVITHHFKAADFQKGFDIMLSGQSGKVILDWD